jgi:hypothetical protein
MNLGEILLGLGLVVASGLTFWFALPRGGQVRPFMRKDGVQAYFTVTVLVIFLMGLANIVTGVWPG